ncbi:MAG: enoyl-CoA hydratase [Rhodospirillaceae bacterium]|nr:enoyl-CoA hydratase [Rhodospirillaceae bacterium]|tara:strand:- start:266 stop:1060 length:795 start_codon:yes stop_codon:yes gene_type:complete
MRYKTLQLDKDRRGVARLWLNRPDKHHAMNAQMINELHQAALALSKDETVRVIVIGSDGPIFCAGADLTWMQEQQQKDKAGRIVGARTLSDMLTALNSLPKPVIVRVQGNSFGGGLGLISAADITLSADSAKFCFSETRLGLIPATIGPFIWRKLGEANLRRLIITAKLFKANEAVRCGLVAEAVCADRLDEAVEAEIKTALQAGPEAMAAAKALINTFSQSPVHNAQNETAVAALASIWDTDGARKGVNAFLSKTPPPWAINR